MSSGASSDKMTSQRANAVGLLGRQRRLARPRGRAARILLAAHPLVVADLERNGHELDPWMRSPSARARSATPATAGYGMCTTSGSATAPPLDRLQRLSLQMMAPRSIGAMRDGALPRDLEHRRGRSPSVSLLLDKWGDAVTRTVGIRLLLIVPVLFLVSLGTFQLVTLVPGNPEVEILGSNASAEDYVRVRQELGLDKPWLERYGSWLGKAMRGDLGKNVLPPVESVKTKLMRAFPVSLELAGLATGLRAVRSRFRRRWSRPTGRVRRSTAQSVVPRSRSSRYRHFCWESCSNWRSRSTGNGYPTVSG